MYYSLISSMSKISDAEKFILAAGITDSTQKLAITNLVNDLKNNGIWSKMKALYPMVGGTAASHKFNLKDPRDVNNAFRLEFNGGWTHSSNGALPNGTNGYANTFLNNNLIAQNFGHISIYSRSNINSLSCDIGADSNEGCTSIWSRNNNLTYNQINNLVGNYLTVSNTNSLGHYISNRIASNILNSWKNGIKQSTSSLLSQPVSNKLIYIGALNNVTFPEFFTSRQYCFSSIGEGLTDTESTNFYTAVQTFQTTLGRQV